MKKILSLALVFVMMVSLVALAPSASAEAVDAYTVEVTDAVANAGDTVTLDVIITGTVVMSYAFAFEYDASRLEAPEIKNNGEAFNPAGGPMANADYQAAWTSNANDVMNGVDVSEGVTAVTMTFKVKENAPAGDAYVRCAPVANDVLIRIKPDADPYYNITTWDAIEGTVTVLPEGYEAAIPVLNEADFDYKDNGDGTVTLLTYNGPSMEEAWIPSTIDGKTVTILTENNTSYLFNDVEFTTLWIPETVTVINRRAFGSGVVQNLYVLNKDVNFAHKQSVNSDDVNFFGPAGSTVIDHITTWVDEEEEFEGWTFTEYDYVAPNTVTIVTDTGSATYEVSGNQITAPGAPVMDGKAVVAWKYGENVALPGAVVTINGNTTFEPMTVGMVTDNGASMKIADSAADIALRFTASINIEDYEAVVDAFGKANVTHGMIIVPQQYVSRAGGFTHAALEAFGKGYLDFAMTGCYSATETDYILAANVKGFSSSTLLKNPRFNAVGYIAITIDEVTTYVYSDYDTSTARDLKFVAESTMGTLDQESDAYKWLEALVGDIGA